jgi:hypothetical protein
MRLNMKATAHFGGGAVTVVGQRLDDQGDAAGTVALVPHFLVVGVVAAGTAALDRAVDPVLGHVLCPSRDDGGAQARIGSRVRQS